MSHYGMCSAIARVCEVTTAGKRRSSFFRAGACLVAEHRHVRGCDRARAAHAADSPWALWQYAVFTLFRMTDGPRPA
ncbi:hypothetical protein QO002_000767 [Pararhizobium capsulatum DSM 1112]|uniref:Uncharacterized protein n=1 Tax=Pararhizobium capsulatum DSM 1112 TaxID=1121113 RepID=A0ABU0BK51_9HYPH|nr:hypothetical protein [Pararhizobium capsulatum DSM 1112]